jgi:RHS repeat-associated protein
VYGLGQLAKVRSSDGHKEVPIYDNFGRSIRMITTLPGAGTFQTSQTFDHFGRPFQSFDASSRSVVAGDNSVSVHEANGLRGTQTIYNDLGYVKEIQNVRQYEGGSRIGFYQRNEKMDERGNVVKYVLGNGVEVNRDFYTTTGLIKLIDAQRPQPFNTAIQSLLYYWDDLGNLTGRTTLGEGDTDLLESFEYDSINRLDRSIVNYQGQSSYVDVTYDKLGNITSKSDVGSYLYGGNGAGPHAVTTVGNTSYHYDNNGNNYLGDGRVLKYNAFDKVIEVTRGAYKTQFQYGPDRSRYLRIDADSGDTDRQASGKTTFYLGNVELIRHTAGARNGEVEYKRNLGVAIENILYNRDGSFLREKTEYLLHDHLGSVERIVSDFLGTGAGENVQLIQKMSFDPWGQRRNLQNYQFIEGDVLAAFDSSTTTRGFTGHEMVDGVGIIHMNGRIYDGKIARFLQADPFIQAPFDTQSLNRYSYVRNNPLNKTDPSGYSWVQAAVAAVYWAVGTYVVADLLITLGAENLAGLVSIAGCASGNQASCAAASFGSNYAFTYDFGKASRAAAISYYSVNVYGYAGDITEGAYLANAVANGFVGGIAAELGGGDFGDGFLSAGVSALAKPYIRGIGTDEYSSSRVAARAILGGTISELTGGKFANGAVSAAMAQLFNAEKTRGGKATSRRGQLVANLSTEQRAEYHRLLAEDYGVREALFTVATLPYGGLGAKGFWATVKGFFVVKGGLSSFSQASKYGVKSYSELKKLTKGTGLEAHHLLEKRFASVLGQKVGDMSSIALTKAEHQVFTNAWRKAIPYGQGTANATLKQVENAARQIYKGHPDLIKSLGF